MARTPPPRAWQVPVPFLALADVFTCAISMIFILLILVDPERVLEQHPPQTDLTLRCTDGGVILASARANAAAELLLGAAVGARLAGLDFSRVLSARVLIAGTAAQGDCINDLIATLDELNRGLSARLVQGAGGAYLLHDVELIEGAAPPVADGAEGAR